MLPSKRVERFEVRAGDCGVSKRWSDFARNRERSELGEGRPMAAEEICCRYGVYRSFVSRYERATGKTGVPTQWAFYAKVRKAKTRDGLD